MPSSRPQPRGEGLACGAEDDTCEADGAPGDILGALLRARYNDLLTVGQIVLRPRFATAQFPARRFEGKLIPIIPPSNTWIVEVLAEPSGARRPL